MTKMFGSTAEVDGTGSSTAAGAADFLPFALLSFFPLEGDFLLEAGLARAADGGLEAAGRGVGAAGRGLGAAGGGLGGGVTCRASTEKPREVEGHSRAAFLFLEGCLLGAADLLPFTVSFTTLSLTLLILKKSEECRFNV